MRKCYSHFKDEDSTFQWPVPVQFESKNYALLKRWHLGLEDLDGRVLFSTPGSVASVSLCYFFFIFHLSFHALDEARFQPHTLLLWTGHCSVCSATIL